MTIQDIRDITSFKWATVVGTSPLSIKMDGDSAPLAMIPDSLVDPATLAPGDRVRVELTMRKAVVHGVSIGGPLRGSEAARDARFGVPVSTPDIVALANRQVIWFNTDKGWHESYHAPVGLAGLTAPGLVSIYPQGWYPIPGEGPLLRMKNNGSDPTVSPAQLFTTFWQVDRQVGGTDWIEANPAAGTFTLKKAGRYTIEMMISVQSGSGDFEQTMTVNSAVPGVGRFSSLSSELRSSVHGFHTMRQPYKLFAANDVIRHFNYSGTYAVGVSSGEIDYLLIKYEGPGLN